MSVSGNQNSHETRADAISVEATVVQGIDERAAYRMSSAAFDERYSARNVSTKEAQDGSGLQQLRRRGKTANGSKPMFRSMRFAFAASSDALDMTDGTSQDDRSLGDVDGPAVMARTSCAGTSRSGLLTKSVHSSFMRLKDVRSGHAADSVWHHSIGT